MVGNAHITGERKVQKLQWEIMDVAYDQNNGRPGHTHRDQGQCIKSTDRKEEVYCSCSKWTQGKMAFYVLDRLSHFLFLKWLQSTFISQICTSVLKTDQSVFYCLSLPLSPSTGSVTLHLLCQTQISLTTRVTANQLITAWESSHITSIDSACWIPLAEEILTGTHQVTLAKAEN